MRDFNVLERQEHYFRCSVDNIASRYCRIVIDENSRDLPLGKSTLHVEEVTDRYEHRGKDCVFRLTLPVAEQHSIEICTLNAGPKNRFTYKECLRLGGKWEPVINEWVFSGSVKDQVSHLETIVHSKPVTVEVLFKETITAPQKELTLFGVELVKGLNINFTPIMHKGITVKKGDISYVTGPNAKTIARAGTLVRLIVPQQMLESTLYREEYFAALDYRVIKTRAKRSSK